MKNVLIPVWHPFAVSKSRRASKGMLFQNVFADKSKQA